MITYATNFKVVFYVILGFLSVTSAQYETTAVDNSSNRPSYRVAVTLHPPLVGWSEERHEYYGLIVDILEEVSVLLNFHYVIHDVTNMDNVTYHSGGYFTGVIGEVNSSRADIGAADLMVNDARDARAVTFSLPFFTTGAQILMLKPESSRIPPTFLLVPFSVGVWCLSAFCFVVMGVLFCLIVRYSPTRQDEMSPMLPLYNGPLNNDSLLTTTLTTVFQTTGSSSSAAAKFLTTLWRCLTLCLVVLYTSNLTCAFMATRGNRNTLPFKTFQEMVGQSNIQYGGWFDMRFNLNDELQSRMNRFINSKYSHYSNMEEAMKKIRSTNGRYAAIVNGEHGKWVVSHYCDLLLLSEKLFNIYYSFSCQKNPVGEALCEEISQSLMSLRESGTLFSLYNHWSEKMSNSECHVSSEDEFYSRAGQPAVPFEPIELSEIVLVFVLVLVGVVTTVAVLIYEIKCKRPRQTVDSDTEIGERSRLNNGSRLSEPDRAQ